MWGIRAFCRFCPEECGALVGDSFLSKMAAIVPARTSGYISAHWSGHTVSVHRYLWNPFHCYSNQCID